MNYSNNTEEIFGVIALENEVFRLLTMADS